MELLDKIIVLLIVLIIIKKWKYINEKFSNIGGLLQLSLSKFTDIKQLMSVNIDNVKAENTDYKLPKTEEMSEIDKQFNDRLTILSNDLQKNITDNGNLTLSDEEVRGKVKNILKDIEGIDLEVDSVFNNTENIRTYSFQYFVTQKQIRYKYVVSVYIKDKKDIRIVFENLENKGNYYIKPRKFLAFANSADLAEELATII